MTRAFLVHAIKYLTFFILTVVSVVSLAGEPETFTERCRRLFVQADSLWLAREPESSHALLVPLETEARALADSTSLLAILLRRGHWWASLGQARAAESCLREAADLADAEKDTLSLCRALRWLGVSIDAQGRPGARAIWDRQLRLAQAVEDSLHEAWALVGLAYLGSAGGELTVSRIQYARAVDIFRKLQNVQGEMWALTGLGIRVQELGLFPEARKTYRRSVELARKAGYVAAEANALNNLGTLEYHLGDPGEATRCFRNAYELHRADNNLWMAVIPAANVALCMTDLGRYEDASELLDQMLETCRREGYSELEASVLKHLGDVRAAEGRDRAAATFYRSALAGDRLTAGEMRMDAFIGLSRTLAKMDSSATALGLLEIAASELDDVNAVWTQRLELALGERLMDAGRWEEALARLAPVRTQAESLGVSAVHLESLILIGRCLHALERPEQALASLQRAAEAWESERGVPLDPQWREQRGALARELYPLLAKLSLEHPPHVPRAERQRRVFEMLQVFKARTLYERVVGPGGTGEKERNQDPYSPVKLERLQEEILRDGELLLDVYFGSDLSLVFAVTAQSFRMIRLPGEDSVLAPKLRLFRQLIASLPGGRPPSLEDEEALQTAGRALGQLVLGDSSDLLASARRVILVPDGSLNLIPISAWELSGVSPGSGPHEFVRIPSAALLVELRTRSSPPPSTSNGRPRVLAVAGVREVGGENLSGARKEVLHLGRRFSGVDVRLIDGKDVLAPRDLGQYDVLHLAAHTTIDDQYPWRSGIRIAGNRGTDELRAAEIASLRLPARIAVLSGCETAGGRLLSGEGVLGLCGAFLSAGVPVVLATLWAVDDHTTSRLMDGFYRSLSRGETAAGALREAQSEIRGESSTRHPFFWAGFVLVGEGDIRVPLRGRPSRTPYVLAALVLVVAGAALAWIRSR